MTTHRRPQFQQSGCFSHLFHSSSTTLKVMRTHLLAQALLTCLLTFPFFLSFLPVFSSSSSLSLVGCCCCCCFRFCNANILPRVTERSTLNFRRRYIRPSVRQQRLCNKLISHDHSCDSSLPLHHFLSSSPCSL